MTLQDELKSRIDKHQQHTFRFTPKRRISTLSTAVKFVDERGFVAFWPISGTRFPSLWGAVAGDKPVPNAHDDPGHVTWGWKDSMLGKGKWYYARFLKQKNTFISNAMLPNFYALSPNYGEYESDYLISYQQGQMTAEAKAVYEALLTEGPLDSLALRKASRMLNESSSSRFNNALTWLQLHFMIMPTGVSEAGAWNYAFIYDITARFLPDLVDRTRYIDDESARQAILTAYLETTGFATERELKSMLRWAEEDLRLALERLPEMNGDIVRTDKNTTGLDGWILGKLLD